MASAKSHIGRNPGSRKNVELGVCKKGNDKTEGREIRKKKDNEEKENEVDKKQKQKGERQKGSEKKKEKLDTKN